MDCSQTDKRVIVSKAASSTASASSRTNLSTTTVAATVNGSEASVVNTPVYTSSYRNSTLSYAQTVGNNSNVNNRSKMNKITYIYNTNYAMGLNGGNCGNNKSSGNSSNSSSTTTGKGSDCDKANKSELPSKTVYTAIKTGKVEESRAITPCEDGDSNALKTTVNSTNSNTESDLKCEDELEGARGGSNNDVSETVMPMVIETSDETTAPPMPILPSDVNVDEELLKSQGEYVSDTGPPMMLMMMPNSENPPQLLSPPCAKCQKPITPNQYWDNSPAFMDAAGNMIMDPAALQWASYIPFIPAASGSEMDYMLAGAGMGGIGSLEGEVADGFAMIDDTDTVYAGCQLNGLPAPSTMTLTTMSNDSTTTLTSAPTPAATTASLHFAGGAIARSRYQRSTKTSSRSFTCTSSRYSSVAANDRRQKKQAERDRQFIERNRNFTPIEQPSRPILTSSNIAAVIVDNEKLILIERMRKKHRVTYPIMQVGVI